MVRRRTGAVVAAPSPARLTLAVTAARVRYPTPARVTGQLRFGDGAPPAGTPVAFEFQLPGGAWQPVGRASADAAGRYGAALEVPASGLVRAVFPGDGGRAPVLAAPVAIAVLPRLTLALSVRRVRRRRAVRVTGVLSPAPAGGRVECVLERQVGARWVVVQRKRINVRRAAFATTVRPAVAGLHRVSVSTPGATERLRLRVSAA